MTHCGKLARPIVTVANVGLDNSRLWEELAKGQLVMKKASFAFRRAVCIPVLCCMFCGQLAHMCILLTENE